MAGAQAGGTPDKRNDLAADRTVYAAERTAAAWVRTGHPVRAHGRGLSVDRESSVEPAGGEW